MNMHRPQSQTLPPKILKACLILGIEPEDFNEPLIRIAWKRQVSAMARIGDTESPSYLKMAKDTLIGWLRSKNVPSGEIHGHSGCKGWQGPPPPRDPDQPSGVPRRPLPTLGAGQLALPEPDLRPDF
jgi:hypothetical protein